MTLLDIAQSVGLRPVLASSTGGGEYCSPCPDCGGTDRLRIWPERQKDKCKGAYWCRKCGMSGDTIEFCKLFLDMTYPEAYAYVNGCEPEPLLHQERSPRRTHIAPRKLQSLKLPSPTWRTHATRFAQEAHQNLLNEPEKLEYLHKRGITRSLIEQYQIGFCPHDEYVKRSAWGMHEEQPHAEEQPRKIWLPKGIVMPRRHNSEVVGLNIRRTDWTTADTYGKYIKIPGSMNGFVSFGDEHKDIMIFVETEFDACALTGIVGDIAFAVAVAGSTINPDNITDHLAQQKTVMIIPDNDPGGSIMAQRLYTRYQHALICHVPTGKDVGEAIENGVSMRNLIMQALVDRAAWSDYARLLIAWFYRYMHNLDSKMEHSTRLNSEYVKIEQEIARGPQCSKAIIERLTSMKQLVDMVEVL